nr:hypothetical protein [Bacillus sp. FMQ74]
MWRLKSRRLPGSGVALFGYSYVCELFTRFVEILAVVFMPIIVNIVVITF